MPRHGQRAPPVPQLVRRFPGKIERVGDPGQALRGRGRLDGPLPARVGQCDQVAGQVPAVDRGDIGRIERAKIARVVPIVEMPAKPREAWPSWPASSPAVQSLPRFPAMRNRGPPPPREDTAQDWSATSGGPAPGPGPPGNCPAAACGRLPSRRSRSTATSAVRLSATPDRRWPIRTFFRRSGEVD